MFIASNVGVIRTCVITGILGLGLVASAAAQTTIWVGQEGDDDLGLGSFSEPYATINRAIDEALVSSPPITIKVAPGDYNWEWESAYAATPFPILVPDRTSIEASSTASSDDWPRVGGGVPSSSVEALLCVEADAENRAKLDFKNLWFVGEHTEDMNGPSAVLVRVRGGFFGEVSIDSCHIERSLMDDDTSEPRPSILFDVGWGDGTLTVSQSTIEASAGGGLVMEVGPGTTPARIANPTVYFLDNVVSLGAGQAASHAIRYEAEGQRWLTTQMLEIRGNLIEQDDTSSGGGFGTGIRVAVEPSGGANQTVNKDNFKIIGNTVRDCVTDGIVLSCDRADSSSNAHMATFVFERNTVTGCGEAGIRLDRGDAEGGYLNAEMYGNLLADNTYGIVVQGNDVNAPWDLAGCTIVDNSSYAVALDDEFAHVPEAMVNCIVYGNNGGGDQLGTTGMGGAVAWDVSDLLPAFRNNNFQGYFTSSSCTPDADGNVDYVPGFVDAATGDYHLLSTACSRNKGDNTPSDGPMPTELDIDGEPRIYRADTVNVIDQGADEYSGG